MEAARTARRAVSSSQGSCEDTIKCHGNTLLLVFLKCVPEVAVLRIYQLLQPPHAGISSCCDLRPRACSRLKALTPAGPQANACREYRDLVQREEGQESHMARALSKAVRSVRGHSLRISDEASALSVEGIGPVLMKARPWY